jgi:hypothetical protein
LVQDNLNTHTPASLYETFPPAEARRILQRLDSEAALRRHVEAVESERNQQRRGITWQFTSRDARHKLERLYPVKEHVSD